MFNKVANKAIMLFSNWAYLEDGFKMFFQVNVEKMHNATINIT